MTLLAWIVVGGIAGWLASVVMGTNRSQGIMMDIVMGIAGGIVGGFLANILGLSGVGTFSLWSILIATLGAIVLTLIGRTIRSSTTA